MSKSKIARKPRSTKPKASAEQNAAPIPPPTEPTSAYAQIDAGQPTLTLHDVYDLVGSNYRSHTGAPTAIGFAIEALEDVTRGLRIAIEAHHEGVPEDVLQEALHNTWARAGCARDIIVKLSRGAS